MQSKENYKTPHLILSSAHFLIILHAVVAGAPGILIAPRWGYSCPRSSELLHLISGQREEGNLGEKEACKRQTNFLWNARCKETTVPSEYVFSFGVLFAIPKKTKENLTINENSGRKTRPLPVVLDKVINIHSSDGCSFFTLMSVY